MPKEPKGYHIRKFPDMARQYAKAGATLAGVDIGTYIAQAVIEKFQRDLDKLSQNKPTAGGER